MTNLKEKDSCSPPFLKLGGGGGLGFQNFWKNSAGKGWRGGRFRFFPKKGGVGKIGVRFK